MPQRAPMFLEPSDQRSPFASSRDRYDKVVHGDDSLEELGTSPRRRVVTDYQLGEDPPDGGYLRWGEFSDQIWGDQ